MAMVYSSGSCPFTTLPRLELLAPTPPALPLSDSHLCTSYVHNWSYGRHSKKACPPYHTLCFVFASQTRSDVLERLL